MFNTVSMKCMLENKNTLIRVGEVDIPFIEMILH